MPVFFRKRFNHARVAAAAAILALDGTTCISPPWRPDAIMGFFLAQTPSTQDSLVPIQCPIITFFELDASIHAGFCPVGLAAPNGHIQQSHKSRPVIFITPKKLQQRKIARPLLHPELLGFCLETVSRCHQVDENDQRKHSPTHCDGSLVTKGGDTVGGNGRSPPNPPHTPDSTEKTTLLERNVFRKILHDEILKVGTGPQGSPRSLPALVKVPIHYPSPEGPQLALLRQVHGSFSVACQNGNVQQPCHCLRLEWNFHVTAWNVQRGTGERSGGCLSCCTNCTPKIHIPIFHPNALLHWKNPTAVPTCVPTLAATNSRAIALPNRGIPAEWSKVVMVFQDAARYTMSCQCQSGVCMSEPQAKVKQVHHAPLRWQ